MDEKVRVFPGNVKGKIGIYRLSAFFLALLGAGFRIAAMAASYSPEAGYFETGAFLPAVSDALVIIGVLWGLSAAFLIPKNSLPKSAGPVTNKEYFALIYAAFIMVADAGYRVYSIIGEKKALADEPLFAKERATLIVTVVTLICIFSSLGSAACFILRAAEKGSRNLCGILGMFPVLRAIGGLALPYFDWTVHMNSPVKLMLEFTMLALIPYFLADDRFRLPGDHAKPELWFGLSLASEILCAVCGASGIFAYFSGAELNGELLIEAFFALTMFFVILTAQGAYTKEYTEVPEAPGEETAGADEAAREEKTDSSEEEKSGSSDEETSDTAGEEKKAEAPSDTEPASAGEAGKNQSDNN